MKNVLVLGGGFAGLEAAIFLRKYGFDVTLISERDYLYIYPTSIWVPTGESSFEDVTLPLEKLRDVHGFKLIIDKVESIKSAEKRVYAQNGTYGYDYLVVALGSGKMKHKGIENTLTICGAP
ncbi:MAG TPA: FAD-binding protein, partial [Campylobacteraceae bacterium]|nr:FAD-binding protein [Campylobacteraceae bacterium]